MINISSMYSHKSPPKKWTSKYLKLIINKENLITIDKVPYIYNRDHLLLAPPGSD